MEIDEKFTFAFAAYLLNYAEDMRASENETERRMKICRTCDKFQLLPPPREEEEEALMERFGRKEPFHGCTICGCLLEAKVETFFDRCPIMKWYPATNGEQECEMEQWKKYHEKFMRLYEERANDYVSWWAKRDIIDEELSSDEDE